MASVAQQLVRKKLLRSSPAYRLTYFESAGCLGAVVVVLIASLLSRYGSGMARPLFLTAGGLAIFAYLSHLVLLVRLGDEKRLPPDERAQLRRRVFWGHPFALPEIRLRIEEGERGEGHDG